ncbi:MAG: hypothetical protein ACR2IH_05710 [Pyrinomonadaceae bacterium]
MAISANSEQSTVVRVRRLAPVSHKLDFESFGVSIRIEFDSPDAVEACRVLLEDVLPGYCDFGTTTVPQHIFRVNWNKSSRDSIYQDGRPLFLATPRETVLSVLGSRVRLLVAQFAKDFVFIHAGVVSWADRAIVIPGHSMQGKTTLVAAFVERGAKYYSDEYAIIDKDGSVHPFVKPLSVRRSDHKYKQHDVTVSGECGTTAIPVGMILDTKFKKGAKIRPKEMTNGSAMIALIQNTIPIRENPGYVLSVLKAAVDSAVLIRSPRGEADEAVQSLISFIQASERFR